MPTSTGAANTKSRETALNAVSKAITVTDLSRPGPEGSSLRGWQPRIHPFHREQGCGGRQPFDYRGSPGGEVSAEYHAIGGDVMLDQFWIEEGSRIVPVGGSERLLRSGELDVLQAGVVALKTG